MKWGEVHRLTLILLTDPSSQVGAAVRDWAHPMSREDLVLRDIYDLQHMSKSRKRPKPYPRPWHKEVKKFGTAMSVDQFHAAIEASSN